uniref:FAD:protein FMN transferase n=1 Tax=Candidatus Kentrum eta TaxID=2126337 RepID=A0A450VF62_9GAMM|nr:MAG: thiamine biosynthesis lipoprotein [Candidatus Kentron sp. H]VFJ97934.1 MAG: thiamine biosynthesis lipoprotein [Candidatus Kentron sp. H]VFK03436.1 MAG: thiamine biosynthesis lipoprotein [Candidatus Kentron sp. H]
MRINHRLHILVPRGGAVSERTMFGWEHTMTVALLYIIALVITGCDARPPDLLHYTGTTMGTYYAIKVGPLPQAAPPDADIEDIDTEQLGRDIEGILTEINALMSTYRTDSALSRFNASTRTDWFPVPEDLHTVVTEALAVSRSTGGAFDITVGPLVNLWGFGPSRDKKDSMANEVAAPVGYEKVTTRAVPPALRKDDPRVYLDLSAIAKGFAVDKVAEYLEGKNFANYLVDIGGELRGKGKNAAGKPWQVAIEKPTPGKRAIHQVIAVDGYAVATSGDYRNFFEQDGKRYSHTIDPKTGRPVTHRLASVTVISPSAMRADAMATAISVLGPEAGYRLAERENLPVWLITKTDTGFSDRSTPGFARFVVSER